MTYEFLLKKYGRITLTLQEGGEELGLHWQTVRQMCQRGDIKATKRPGVNGRWILSTKAIADYIDKSADDLKRKTDILPITGKGYKKIV